MALDIPGKVAWSDILDTPFVHVPGGDDSGPDQLPERRRSPRVDLVVVGSYFPLRNSVTVDMAPRIRSSVSAYRSRMSSA
ncbi:MAG: hypothetical protein M0Z38_02080 [Deltaproteobacteria bacterium]|nr:hypothetical protein [Deltaproteobacteria bacterium]